MQSWMSENLWIQPPGERSQDAASSPRVCCRLHMRKQERDLGKRCNSGLRAGENVWHKHTWLNLFSLLEAERWLAAMSVYPRKQVGLAPLKSHRERQ